MNAITRHLNEEAKKGFEIFVAKLIKVSSSLERTFIISDPYDGEMMNFSIDVTLITTQDIYKCIVCALEAVAKDEIRQCLENADYSLILKEEEQMWYMNTKIFWKTYWLDLKNGALLFKIAILLILLSLFFVIGMYPLMIPVSLGYIVSDPFNYYWISYKKHLNEKE